MIRFILLFTALILTNLNANAQSIQGFFFFGDSLTDSGYQNNNPALKNSNKSPLWTSPNGHTWAYYFLKHQAQQTPHANTTLLPNNMIAKALYNPVPTHINPKLDGNNFAAGGSTTEGPGVLNSKVYKAPSLLEQVDYFVNTYAPQHAIAISQQEYLLWSGDNNLMKKLVIEMTIEHLLQRLYLTRPAAAIDLFDFKKLSTRFSKTEAQIADNLFTAVSLLKKAGAKKIVVLLLPDVGDTPLIKKLTQDLNNNGSHTLTAREFSTQMSIVTNTTNQLIQKKLTHQQVAIIDVNDILHPLMSLKTPTYFQEKPSKFGRQQTFLIFNSKNTACPTNELALTCIPNTEKAAHYLFEDLAHPTDQTHQMIGDYVYYQSELDFKKIGFQ